MSERYAENLPRLEFKSLQPFDELQITTGRNEQAWHYKFDILSTSGHWPAGKLSAVTPEGQATEEYSFELHGCGQWTSRRQNPVQQQERAFTPYFDGLYKGEFMLGMFAGETERSRFDNPGQEITEIVHIPYRENAILEVFAREIGPLSVKQLVELTATETLKLKDAEVRTTLKKLVTDNRITLLKKNVLLFQSPKINAS